MVGTLIACGAVSLRQEQGRAAASGLHRVAAVCHREEYPVQSRMSRAGVAAIPVGGDDGLTAPREYKNAS